MTLALFSILFVSTTNNDMQKYLVNWTSISYSNYFITFTFAIVLLSIAGIPPLAGFYAKLSVLLSLFFDNQVVIASTIAVFSCLACFYYIRFIKIMSFTNDMNDAVWFSHSIGNNEFILSILFFAITLFLFMPNILLNVCNIACISLL
jgi:NADH-quinone oxidoreductase subunit N